MVGHQLNYHDSPGRFQFSEQLYIQWRVVIYKRKGGAGYENCRISGIGRKEEREKDLSLKYLHPLKNCTSQTSSIDYIKFRGLFKRKYIYI